MNSRTVRRTEEAAPSFTTLQTLQVAAAWVSLIAATVLLAAAWMM